MTCLAPNEWLSGSPQTQHDLVGRLAVLRASPDLDRHHSMISGSLAQLSDWLNQRHGPAAFVTIFKSPAYCGRYQGEEPKRSIAYATASFGAYPAERRSRTPVIIADETV